VAGFWDDEFLDFDVHAAWSKIAEDHFCDVDSQGFQQPPRPSFAEAE